MRLPAWTVAAAALTFLAAVLAHAWRADPPASVRHAGLPMVTMPLPPVAPAAQAKVEALEAPEPPTLAHGHEPAHAAATMHEPSPVHEARATHEAAPAHEPAPGPACAGPCVAVVVSGLGLARELTERALTLPGEVGLAFSPYAPRLADWKRKAAVTGQPVLLDLPLQPARYPADDSGPLTLLLRASAQDQEALLARALGEEDWLAVVASAGAFAREPQRFTAIARALREHGVALIERDGNALQDVADAQGLAYVAAQGASRDAPPALIDLALGKLEGQALRQGEALAVLPATRLVLDRLDAWLPSLADKGLTLVGPGALLRGRSPLSHEAKAP